MKNPSGLPVVGRRWYEIGNGKARARYRDDCLAIVRSSIKKVRNSQSLIRSKVVLFNVIFFAYYQQHGDAFYLYTDSGYRLILSDKYVDLLRNEKRLDFITALAVVSQVPL